MDILVSKQTNFGAAIVRVLCINLMFIASFNVQLTMRVHACVDTRRVTELHEAFVHDDVNLKDYP